jgi:hypothetical protein
MASINGRGNINLSNKGGILRKMSFRKITNIFALAVAAAIPLLTAAPVLAASATVSLVSSSSVTKGSNITVTIKENSGAEPVNAASASLSYPTDKLSYVSISNSSVFNIAAASSGGSGSVKVDRGSLSAVTGSQTVASVTFKALSDSGTAKINVTSASVISANTNADIASGTSGTTITLKAPAAAPATPAAAPADTIPPKITAVATQDVKSSSVTITWTTSEPSTSEVSYGLSQSYGLSATDPTPVTAHKVVLNSPLIQPATKYHFMVKSVDPAGNPATSPDSSFSTTGATLSVTVKNQKNKPVAGAEVQIDGQKATSNKQGIATLNNVGLGKKYGIITYNGNKYSFTADIASADKPNAAVAQIKVPANYALPIALGVIVLLAIDYLIGWKSGQGGLAGSWASKLRSKLPFVNRPGPPPSTPASGGGESVIRPSGRP